MKLPLSWLKDIIDINLPPQQIAKILTQAGLEVDAVTPIRPGFESVVVAQVVKSEKHPEAEKLSVATVSDGTETYQVVCGAPNCRAGIKTAFARVGASLTEEDGTVFKLKKAKLRGVESFGMLCAWKELGLGEDGEGIIEFDERMQVGTDLAEMYGDHVFEIGLTPNLGHCASAMGVSRELFAATDAKLTPPLIYVKEEKGDPIAINTSVDVVDTEKCQRYTCRLIKGVTIGPSPEWLQKRLLACDMRPVNNVVDVTNYVLMEFGHPLHAFDFDEVSGRKIIVRHAVEGELFKTLDDKERILSEEDLLICDQNKPLAIAGVMGGSNSEVKETTRNILLESAYFLPSAIRRTSKRLMLQTEASKRFERGCDPNQLIRVLDRAAMLIQEIAGGTVCEGVIDIKLREFPEKILTCRLSRINATLGTHISVSEVENSLRKLEMACQWDGNDTFTVTVPTYRVDVQAEIDLIEEVARIFGYDNIPKKSPKYGGSQIANPSIFILEREVRQRLLSEGLQEFLTCDLIGPTLLNIVQETLLPEEMVVKVLNPTSIEQSILRTSLLPGLLELVKYNYDHQNQDISGFEIGRVHFKEGDDYKEQYVAAFVFTGMQRPRHWDRKPKEVDIFDLKGVIENMLSELAIDNYEFKNTKHTFFHPGRQASINVGGINIGSMGEVHPAIMRRLDVPQRLYFAEIDLHPLIKLRPKKQMYKDLHIYPSSARDLTLTLNDDVAIGDVLQDIKKLPLKYLEDASLIDIYKGEKIGKEHKNVTFRFVYRDNKKTIAQEAVDVEHARIISELESRYSRR